MARVRDALFGTSRPATLERYALLEKLGEGSHGAVYAAWDPRLDRKVALKVLHGATSGSLEHEARTLAKLTHPNVVTVHDVGEADGQLFLAMEFVDGTPLSTLDVETLGWAPIVAAYRQAAAGLNAAHQAGVLHRDFKPANALIGKDGRVRVVDFGLARDDAPSDATDTETAAAGTPRYMAPEQHRAGPLDARTDQFGFCAALWEALYGRPAFSASSLDGLAEAKQRPPAVPERSAVPSRVGRVLQRGLAADPDARYPSMRELDQALARTQQRRVTWAVVGVAAAAAVLGLANFGAATPPCEGAQAPPPRWTADTPGALQRSFEATTLPHAPVVASTTAQALQRWADRWGAARHDACLTHAQGLQSDAALDLRTRCLGDQRRRFDALLDVLLAADGTAVNKAVDAAAALPAPEACAALDPQGDTHPIPAGQASAVDEATVVLARARTEMDAGHLAEARSAAEPWIARCEDGTLTHPPTCVEAQVLSAEVASLAGEHDTALVQLRAAAVAAQRAGLAEPFARAAASLTWERGEVDAAFDDALTWAALGRATLQDHPSPAILGSLLNSEGSVLTTAGRYDDAVRAHRERIALVGEHSPAALASLANLGNVANRQGRFDDAEAAYTQALALGEPALGSTHPKVLMVRQNRAGIRVHAERVGAGLSDLQALLRAQRSVLGEDHPDLAATLTNMSKAAYALERYPAALRHANEATRLVVAAYGEGSHWEVEARLAEADALLALQRPDEAVQTTTHAVARARTVLGETHVATAFALRGHGLALRASGDVTGGETTIREARRRFEALGNTTEAEHTATLLPADP